MTAQLLNSVKRRGGRLQINVDPPIVPDHPVSELLTLVGGFRIPAATIDGFNTRYLSGSFDYDSENAKWIANHGNGKRIIEYYEPGPMGIGLNIDSWPLLTTGRSQVVFSTFDKFSPSGVLWIDADTVLCNSRKSYRSGFDENWMATMNLATGTEVAIPLADPTSDENGNFHMMQAFGSGFCRIPQHFADLYTGGRTIGTGRGGYDVLGSPFGPSLAAIDLADPFPAYVIFDHPDQYPCRRDGDYVFPTTSPLAQLPFWRNPVDGVGFWIGGDCSSMAWVPGIGILSVADRVRGAMDYRAQGDDGSSAYFGVSDPTVFYNPATGGANRGDHQSEIENQSLPPATFARVLYKFTESDLVEVAQGLREPWECEPTYADFPQNGLPWANEPKNHTKIAGLHWDNSRSILWACLTQIYNSNKFAVLAAYEVAGI